MYGASRDAVYVHLYGDSECQARIGGADVSLRQATEYPWQEKVVIHVDPAKPQRFALMLRIPGWCRAKAAKIRRNGKAVSFKIVKGYARIDAVWNAGDRVELTLPMPVEQVESHPSVRMNCAKVALQRGPVVYCLEEVDNGRGLADIAISKDAKFSIKPIKPEKSLGSALSLSTMAQRRDPREWNGALYRATRTRAKKVRIKAVPYCLWNNRGDGEMVVWLNRAT
jgi:DUF1680 family protein